MTSRSISRGLVVAAIGMIISLGTAVSCRASGVDLGAAGGYSILGLNGNTTINLSSGPLRVNGNVGVGDHAQLNFSGGGQINGRVDFSSTATLNTGGNTITGGTHQIDFSALNTAVQNEVTSLNSLAATQTFSSITNATTLTSAGGQNVISVTGDIHLSGGNFVLNGSPSDTFIFKIGGTMELSGDTHIVLTGGLKPSNVLWDFIGSGSQFQTSGNSVTEGIFLAPDRVININGGVHSSEFISGISLSFQSNPIVNPIPEGSTNALLILGGFICVAGAIWRKNSSAVS
jgi:hypothetical protein